MEYDAAIDSSKYTFIKKSMDGDISGDFQASKVYTVKGGAANGGNITVDKASTYEGDVVSITATPKSGYKLKDGRLKASYTEGNTQKTVGITEGKFTMPAQDVTVTGEFESVGGGSGGSSGGSGGGIIIIPPSKPETPSTEVKGLNISSTIKPTIDDNTATLGITSNLVDEFLKEVKSATSGTDKKAIVEVAADSNGLDLGSLVANISKGDLQRIANENVSNLIISNSKAKISLDKEAMESILGQSGDSISFTVNKLDNKTLKRDIQDIVGERPVYDSQTKSVRFKTNHFSEFAVGYRDAKGLENLQIKTTSKTSKGKILLSWKPTHSKVIVDGYEVFRSTKKYSGFTKKPFFTRLNGRKTTYINSKSLIKGKTYYYKVRAYIIVDGEKVYSNWSTKAWEKVK